ncbi:MAG: hypothetical protein WCA10_16850 [Terracidiphilus sp.]
MTKEVAFEPLEGPGNDVVNEQVDKAYRGSTYRKPMIGERARAETVVPVS